ncbi:glycosyl hydrolase family 65 protein [Companilactobacillus kimchii]|uniref:glycosyl hydrolase family 65 protein n=1 Tax=Companilactobacillus kimchii TaxID=2801452 RepID=UPI000AE4513B|nr:glycosyl hydrolase family 65 protein [Companilactobacillus kimchii]
MLYIQNNLPKLWNKLTIRIQYQGRLLNIEYTQNNTKVTIISGDPINIVVNGVKSTVEK